MIVFKKSGGMTRPYQQNVIGLFSFFFFNRWVFDLWERVAHVDREQDSDLKVVGSSPAAVNVLCL